MIKTPRLSIILPIYNEHENIHPVVREIHEVMSKSSDPSYEIILVDDGSRDGSAELIRQLAKVDSKVCGVFFGKNSGQSAAFDAGFRVARGEVVATMDADGQSDPHELPTMLARLNEGFDVVSGWRRKRRDGFFLRRIPSRVANFLIRRVTKTIVHDLGCSLRVYRAPVLKELRLYGEMHRFICPLLEMNGAKVTELEVNHRPRAAGTSKYGIARTMKVLLDLIHIFYIQNYRTKPIYIFGGMGALSVFLGFFLASFSLFEKIQYGIWVHRNPLFLISLACVMVGFQFIGVGLIAETLVRIYFESQNKTPYQIIEKVGDSAIVSES